MSAKLVLSSPKFQNKVRKVMREFRAGRLRTRGGRKVTNRKQAIAIALSEARKLVRGK